MLSLISSLCQARFAALLPRLFPNLAFGVDDKESELIFVRPANIFDALEAFQEHPILHRHIKGIFPVGQRTHVIFCVFFAYRQLRISARADAWLFITISGFFFQFFESRCMVCYLNSQSCRLLLIAL
jgi:hypothetical protein